MRKIIFGIFAHPDDEAFGPSGTLLLETRGGTEVHLLTLTLGDAGANPDNHADLSQIRRREWEAAGSLMGAKSMQYLGFHDGHLDNIQLIEAGHKIVEQVTDILRSIDSEVEIEFMSSDLNGISGHIDHIVAARAACWAFYQLQAHDTRFTRIRLSCIPRAAIPTSNTDWLYMEPGRLESDIDEIVDARHLKDEIIQIMRAHHSQRADGESHIARRSETLGLNYFIVKT